MQLLIIPMQILTASQRCCYCEISFSFFPEKICNATHRVLNKVLHGVYLIRRMVMHRFTSASMSPFQFNYHVYIFHPFGLENFVGQLIRTKLFAQLGIHQGLFHCYLLHRMGHCLLISAVSNILLIYFLC